MALKRTVDSSAALNWAAAPHSGLYFYPVSGHQTGTSGALGTNTLRLAPWYLPVGVAITRLGGEIATVGEAGSKVRLGIYRNHATLYYPGALVVDAGQINGDSATVQELTVAVTLTAGLYWVGGVVQTVTTTQPTVRVTNNAAHQLVPLLAGATMPGANETVASITATISAGALPANFPGGGAGALVAPRLFAKAA